MNRQRELIGIVATIIICGAAAAQGPGAEGWLNVQDLGASGSEYQTSSKTTAGSNIIEVADAGDFEVGQGVMISRCNIQTTGTLYGPESPYRSKRDLAGAVEMRGYDGAAGSWLIYILEVDGADPLTFRWSDDLARSWTERQIPITHDWQTLSNGVECKFVAEEWEPGNMIVFVLRDQLISTIEKIEGNSLTLADPANRSAEDAVVLHNDTTALQAAIDRAIKDKRSLYFPNGRYLLSGRLSVRGASSITLQGQSSTDTILDISNGTGACFSLYGGNEVTARNFRMVGHTGMKEAAGSFRTSSNMPFWASALKGCQAMTIHGTERTLIENIHASRMGAEAFYSQAGCRTGENVPKQYQKSLTYYRCSVTDCAANAFNNNDTGENTSVLYCRVDGAGWHAAEMPAKFFRFIGNYVRNAGPVTVGDLSSRPDYLYELGCGQAIIADNVFEGIGKCGGVNINHGSSQVAVNSNLFINFNGPAIRATSVTTNNSFPSRNITISNNIIDLTYPGDDARGRTGITVSASNTIVSDNQIFVRGECDESTRGIRITEPAINVNVHDNQVSNCGIGIITGRAKGTVREVIDERTFLTSRIPLEWKTSHLYRGWGVVWLTGNEVTGQSVIDHFDAETTHFILREPREIKQGEGEIKQGEAFEIFPPAGANWRIRNNTITGCQTPVLLDSYGSETSIFEGNTITRGQIADVKVGLLVHGGFDEEGSVGMSLYLDRAGRELPRVCARNVFQNCSIPVATTAPDMWTDEMARDNLFVECP